MKIQISGAQRRNMVITALMVFSKCRRTTSSLKVYPLLGAGLLFPKILLQGRNGRKKCPREIMGFQRNRKKIICLLALFVFQEAWSWLSLMMTSLHGFRVGLIIETVREEGIIRFQ
uniref:Uncharacterized protein n=1 Tax=Arundo donax TaxID=35708 RepID=A0A0A8ZX86_ARUDO